MTYINLLAMQEGCTIGEPMYDLLQYAFTGIKLMVPALILALSVADFTKAVVAQKPEDMDKAKYNLIKRLIIGVVIFFLPIIVDTLLDAAGITNACGLE